MAQLKGLARRIVLSCFRQESASSAAAYDTAVDNTDSDFASEMQGFEASSEWTDTTINDKEEITGTEFGTTQEVVLKGNKLTYKESKTKPHTLATLLALACGQISTAANVTAGYTHSITPVDFNTDLPSIQIDDFFGGVRKKYNGMKVNSLKISCAAGEPVSVEAEFIGSGTRATEVSTDYPDKISESWLFAHHGNISLENGTSISIANMHVQDTQSISSGTPDSLNIIMKSFEVMINNNLEQNYGYGSQVVQQLEKKKREITFTCELQFENSNELDWFENQTDLAIDLDFSGAILGAGETKKYGFKIVIPKMKLNVAPTPQGGVADNLTCTFDCSLYDQDSFGVIYFTVLNLQTGYLSLAS